MNLNDEHVNFLFKYRISYKPDSAVKKVSVEYANLIIGREFSKFETVGSRALDSVRSMFPEVLTSKNTNIQDYADKMLSVPRTKFFYVIFKKLPTGHLYCYDKIGDVVYKYIETDSTFNWLIGPEKAIIAGYACQRATTKFAGRAFEAWFTREIPVSDGPYKFHGLPGFIVKVNDLRQQYSFELVYTNKPATVIPIVLPTKTAPIITKTELYQGQAVYNLQLANRMVAMGDNTSAADRQRLLKPMNPLELQ